MLQVAELDASTEYVGNGLLPSDASSGGGGLAVAGAMLACDQAVKVLVGPVVGLVTGDTARILLEVDHVAEVSSRPVILFNYNLCLKWSPFYIMISPSLSS